MADNNNYDDNEVVNNPYLEDGGDDFDFLADLMQGMSASTSTDTVDDNSSVEEHVAPETIEVEDTRSNEGETDSSPAPETEPARRVPLFKQMQLDRERAAKANEAQSAPKVDREPEVKEDPFVEEVDEEPEDIWGSEEVLEEKEVEPDDVFMGDFDKVYGTPDVQVDEVDREPEVVHHETGAGQVENSVNSMLDELTRAERSDELEDEVEDGAPSRVELDPEVIVPLETPEMSEVKVTADGRTLADMLPGIRGGNKKASQVLREIKNQETVVVVDDKKFSDNRYTKHVEVISKEKEEQDERRALSKGFLQRNAKFTEQEKIIMDNLGVSNEGFAQLMKSTELTKEDKGDLLGLGRYGAEKHFSGRRYRTTVGDTAMLEFLTKFKFANTRILRWISNEPQSRTWRKLNRLQENGLVESQTLIGVPDLWAATQAGVAVSGYSYDPGLRPMPKMITVSATMGVNYIAACLWFNTVNVLNLDDFPAHNRVIALQEDGRETVRGEMLVSELEIRSSMGKEITPGSTTMQTLGDERLYDVISDNVTREFDVWKDNGMVGDSPEMIMGNEYMWILFPKSQLTLSYHVPDLVIKRERGPNGEPKSIAVEMERYDKTNDKYDKIMLAYKLDTDLYEKVIWITPNMRIARALEKAAVSVGFTNYAIIPIITETGVYTKQDIWMI